MSSYNYTILRIWGIPIRINISLLIFLPALAWLIGSGEQIAAYSSLINSLTPATVEPAMLDSPNDRWLIGASAAVALFGSVTFHELGHAWAAMRYDIEVDSITLWLLGGLASLSSMPEEWDQEFWIAIAGPISSLVLAAGCLGALLVVPESAVLLVYVLGFVAVMNIVLAVFNMLPAFPMDGGRVLRALLARNRPYVSATQTAARVGTLFAFLFVFIGIFVVFSPLLLLLALFIYMAATSESRSVVIAELLSGLTVADLIDDTEPVHRETPLEEVFGRMFGARRSDLAVVDARGDIVGVLTASALKEVPQEEYATRTVGEILRADLPRIDSETTAADGLYELMRGRSDVAIVERDGTAVGLVSRGDFMSALDLRRESVPF
jgi:Zn-dependent protease